MISIHVTAKVTTENYGDSYAEELISIHVTAKVTTLICVEMADGNTYFNPRHREGDDGSMQSTSLLLLFQSTSPRR